MLASFISQRLDQYAHFYVDTYVRKIPCRIPESSIGSTPLFWKGRNDFIAAVDDFQEDERVLQFRVRVWRICTFVHAWLCKEIPMIKIEAFYIYLTDIRNNVGFVRVSLSQEARLIFEIWFSDILAMFSSVRPTYHRPLKDLSSPLLFTNVGETKMHIMRYNLKIR